MVHVFEAATTPLPAPQLRMEQATNLYDRDTKKHSGGSVTVTSHRILWVFPTGRFALYLECIQSVSEKSEFFKSAKAIIDLGGPGSGCYVCISFPKGGRDAFVKALRQGISQRGWEKAPEASDVLKMAQCKPAVSAGIGTLIQMQHNQEQATSALLSDALGDLDALMLQAKDMVAVAEKLKEAAAKDRDQRAQGAQPCAGAAFESEDGEYSALLLQAGIVSPVSLEVAGKSFHSELAGQIADFLTPLIGGGTGGGVLKGEAAGGGAGTRKQSMITLTDAYCLYNRARGIDLISPADMRQVSCVLLPFFLLSANTVSFEETPLCTFAVGRASWVDRSLRVMKGRRRRECNQRC
jgi:ESCRT-II complex subunit VPS36